MKEIMNKKYGMYGLILVVVLATVLISGCIGSGETTTNANDPFNGKNAKLDNVSVTLSYGYFQVNGKIMFKNDESYASISPDVNLQDGSKISESIVKNWNDVKKDQWYSFDGMLFSTSENSYSLSDVKSVDFKFDNEIIYTWKNE